MKPEAVWHGTIAFALIGAGLAIIAGTFYLLYGAPFGKNPSTATSTLKGAAATFTLPFVTGGLRFSCDEGKAIEAVFARNSVQLTLSDGRSLILPQAISASGASYANTDGSFVFWNKGLPARAGDTAFIQENGVLTYKGCVST